MTKPDDQIVSRSEDIKKEINSKCLFQCESENNVCEYQKMAKYFPNRMYWTFVIRGTFLNLILTAFISVIDRNLITSLVFFLIYQICLLIYCKVRLNSLLEKVYNNRLKYGEIDIDFENEFYEDYFIRKGKRFTLTIDYSEISRCVENDTNFYLEYPLRNMIIILQKNKCKLELINFIRDKFNLENHLGDISSYQNHKNYKKPNSVRIHMIVLFIATIGCLWGALASMALVDKINPQHGFNFVKNMWVFWLWLPIPIASIILGFRFKRKGLKCTKNIVAGFIMGFILFVYGFFCLFPTFSTDYNKINDYKEYIDASLPSNGELEIQDWGTFFDEDKTEYVIVNVYYDREDVSDLVNSIEKSNHWILSTEMKSTLKILLPSYFKASDSVYYSVYNKTTDEYNVIPSDAGEYEIYAMNYDKLSKQLSLHKYKYLYK